MAARDVGSSTPRLKAGDSVSIESTHFESPLALAQAATNTGLLVDEMAPNSVKRALALADPSLAKRVKTELGNYTNKELANYYFAVKDEVTNLKLERDDLKKQLELDDLKKQLQSKAGSSSSAFPEGFTSSEDGEERN